MTLLQQGRDTDFFEKAKAKALSVCVCIHACECVIWVCIGVGVPMDLCLKGFETEKKTCSALQFESFGGAQCSRAYVNTDWSYMYGWPGSLDLVDRDKSLQQL